MRSNYWGPVIYHWRRERGFTQEELGEKVALSRGIVGAIERCQRQVEDEEVVRFSRALGVSIPDFLANGFSVYLRELQQLDRDLFSSDRSENGRRGPASPPDSGADVIDSFLLQLGELLRYLGRSDRTPSPSFPPLPRESTPEKKPRKRTRPRVRAKR